MKRCGAEIDSVSGVLDICIYCFHLNLYLYLYLSEAEISSVLYRIYIEIEVLSFSCSQRSIPLFIN